MGALRVKQCSGDWACAGLNAAPTPTDDTSLDKTLSIQRPHGQQSFSYVSCGRFPKRDNRLGRPRPPLLWPQATLPAFTRHRKERRGANLVTGGGVIDVRAPPLR